MVNTIIEYISVTDIGLKLCGQAYHTSWALLAKFIITYKVHISRVIKYSVNLEKIRKNAELSEKLAKFLLNK